MKFIKQHCKLIVILFILSGCATKIEHPEIKNEPYDKAVQAIEIKNNIVWVGTFSNGLYKYDREFWSNYTELDGLISDNITCLIFDKSDQLWIGTNKGISILNNEKYTNLTMEEGLYSNDIRSLSCDNENNIWIGTNRNRVTKYDGTAFTAYHVNAQSSGNPGMGHIHTITSDLEGNIWTGSCMTGLSKFDGNEWHDFVNDLNTFVTSSLCSESGDIWIGHYMGAFKFSNEQWTEYTEKEGLADATILSLDSDKNNNIWIGTKNGISAFNGTSWMNYTIPVDSLNAYVSCLACDNDGSVWVGNSKGLLNFKPGI